MKRPVWTVAVVRDTNAPLDLLRDRLAAGEAWKDWHPRHPRACPEIARSGEGWRLTVLWPRRLGIQEDECFLLEPEGDRVRLTYQAHFKGWPVLLLMGWWRLRSERLWERFIQSLGSRGA